MTANGISSTLPEMVRQITQQGAEKDLSTVASCPALSSENQMSQNH